MAEKKSPSLHDTAMAVLAQVQGPVSVEEFAQRVLAVYPSKAKNPLTAIRGHLRSEHAGKTLAFLERQTLVPLRVAMQGVRFRIPLSRQEVAQGVLYIDPAFECFRPQGMRPQDMHLLDTAGQPLATRVVTLKQQQSGLFGSFARELPAFELGDWYRTQRLRRNDHVLVTIADWQHGHFRLEHEPVSRRRRQDIERQNQALANLLFDMLETAADERLYTHRAIPTAYACLATARDYPGDHWSEVIEHDGRMRWDGFAINYSEFRSPFEEVLRSATPAARRRQPPAASQAQSRQIYRFLATLRYRPEIWRRLEIRDNQTLADFDSIMRHAFQHDTGNHLGGFWKLVRRGTTQRFREIDLDSIDPFHEGEGAEQRIAALELTLGDALKYVYDFGDWIEHRLSLEEIITPETGVTYPRVVAQNEPQYQYCQGCQRQGRQTVGTWICLQCSERQRQDVVVCEACLQKEHEDHYAEEMLY